LISKVGIVVPTLGTRPEYLRQCLLSIREAGPAFVLLVTKEVAEADALHAEGLVDSLVPDPGQGLPKAINAGIKGLPKEVEYINWLGDDDLLTAGSLVISSAVLDNEPKTVLLFGSCDYIDEDGYVVLRNKSGSWAVPLMRVGPDLIPQPGALFRRSVFEDVGGLSTKYSWAFDFDLFLRLSKKGHLRFVNKTLAKFRWHPESLSVEHRKKSVAEASLVRISHLPPLLRPVSFLWEWPVRTATLIAGNRVTSLSKKKAQRK
jgi:GT2 family glycosyltransferase